MADQSRRSFLHSGARVALGSVLGGSGLLLPWRGQHAIALTDGAADVPVTISKLPLSSDAMLLREHRRELRALGRKMNCRWNRASPDAVQAEIFRVHALSREAIARICAGPKTWSQCVELAEAAWHIAPKAQDADGDYTVPIEIDGYHPVTKPHRFHQFWPYVPSGQHYTQVLPHLIETVLTLGNGERYDPWRYAKRYSR